MSDQEIDPDYQEEVRLLLYNVGKEIHLDNTSVLLCLVIIVNGHLQQLQPNKDMIAMSLLNWNDPIKIVKQCTNQMQIKTL